MLHALLILVAGCTATPSSTSSDAGVPRSPVDSPADRPTQIEVDPAVAPPPFAHGDGMAVPIDLTRVDVTIALDVENETATARARAAFDMLGAGQPFLDLVPDVASLALDGQALSAGVLAEVETPDGATTLRVLEVALGDSTTHTIDVEYELPEDAIAFEDETVSVAFDMDDLSERGFFEQFGPAGFEHDHFALSIEVVVSGAAEAHRVFANGAVESLGAGHFRVVYPGDFTTSSPIFYLLPESDVAIEETSYDSIGGRTIPITVFASRSGDDGDGDLGDTLARMAGESRDVLEELEEAYGAYAHPALLVGYFDDGEEGGMEYVGAAITSEEALGHEILHQWFARGVLPIDGNAGFIDESIANWRDEDYPRARTDPASSDREPTQLSGFSPYRRSTPDNAYEDGAALLSEIDFALADDGGLRPILRTLYERYSGTAITLETFQQLLREEAPSVDIDAAFDRFVLGRE